MVVTEPMGAEQVQTGRIRIPADGPVQVSLALLQKWAKQNPSAAIEMHVGNLSYSIPLNEFTTEEWVARLGADADKAVIKIVITETNDEQAGKVKQGAANIGADLLVKPVAFEVQAITPDGNAVLLSTFARYVPRLFELDFDIEPGQTTGVYMDDSTGELLPVPTVFRIVNGKTVAKLYRKGNSLYALARAEKHFADLDGHWGKSIVETMANKLLVQGTSERSFEPDKPVTRAEFAAMLVRALALNHISDDASFTDVKGEWYGEDVRAATHAGLVGGYPDGSFRPDARMIRQEMAVTLRRAARYAGKPIEISDSSEKRTSFVDLGEAADWAQADIAAAAKAGMMEGDERNAFRPEAQTTRAEAAAVLKRLLMHADMYSE
ncbi:hypothetical protein DQG23_09985 [Paenibacillus contaminans]|uniref:SLH domain-containing protein n=2 Tax=Paenibacillus contaminans TaxID=450362 RepID=A0A329MPX2_9BACL|nr:hypothetical protein DQG23_09985 [Paenibacillus contaminans]